MLKHALGEQSRDELSADEDTLSQHSDSIMDYRQIKQQSGNIWNMKFINEQIVLFHVGTYNFHQEWKITTYLPII